MAFLDKRGLGIVAAPLEAVTTARQHGRDSSEELLNQPAHNCAAALDAPHITDAVMWRQGPVAVGLPVCCLSPPRARTNTHRQQSLPVKRPLQPSMQFLQPRAGITSPHHGAKHSAVLCFIPHPVRIADETGPQMSQVRNYCIYHFRIQAQQPF